ncbi:MAG: type IV pilus secretin PilQ [Acidobacteriota bacterium]|nr:type IV pilus secretin PilQ [Acidobacteriota bacterium]
MNRMVFCLLWFGAAVSLAGDVTVERVDTYANVNKSSVVIHYTGAPKLQFFALDNSDGTFVLDLPGVFSHFDFATLKFQQVQRVEQIPLDPDESKGISVRFHLTEGTDYHVFDDGPGTLTLFFESTGVAPEVAENKSTVKPVTRSLIGDDLPRVLTGAAGDHRFSRLVVDAGRDRGVVYLTVDALEDYSSFRLHAPERFVLDLRGTIQSLPESRMNLEDSLVGRIRFRQFQSHPSPVTRLVLDLNGEIHVNAAPSDQGLVLVYAADKAVLSDLLEAVAAGDVFEQSEPVEAPEEDHTEKVVASDEAEKEDVLDQEAVEETENESVEPVITEATDEAPSEQTASAAPVITEATDEAPPEKTQEEEAAGTPAVAAEAKPEPEFESEPVEAESEIVVTPAVVEEDVLPPVTETRVEESVADKLDDEPAPVEKKAVEVPEVAEKSDEMPEPVADKSDDESAPDKMPETVVDPAEITVTDGDAGVEAPGTEEPKTEEAVILKTGTVTADSAAEEPTKPEPDLDADLAKAPEKTEMPVAETAVEESAVPPGDEALEPVPAGSELPVPDKTEETPAEVTENPLPEKSEARTQEDLKPTTVEVVAEDVIPVEEIIEEAPPEKKAIPETAVAAAPEKTEPANEVETDVAEPAPVEEQAATPENRITEDLFSASAENAGTMAESMASVPRQTVKPSSQAEINDELAGFQEGVAKTESNGDELTFLFPENPEDMEFFVETKVEKQDSLEDLFAAASKDLNTSDSGFEMASDLDLQLAEMNDPAPRTFYEMLKGVSSTRRHIGRLVVTDRAIALSETADMQDDVSDEDEEGEDFEALFREGDDFESIGEKEYRGFEIAIIDVRDQPVLDLLRFIADQVGINLYVDPSVGDTRATYRFRNMPWDQVLDIILTNAGLEKEFKNGVLRVATIDKFKAEAQAQKELRIERELSVPTETVYRSLNYAKAKDVMPLVFEYMSSRGTIMVDERTNTLIIQDIPKKLTDIRTLLNRLDVMIAQVSIEARIVETTTRFLRELGIQWGLNAAYSPETGTDTGLTFPNRIGLGGPIVGQEAGVGSPEGGYAVNFPVISENPSGVGLTLGNFLDNFKLEISLQLLESEGHGKIISSPKITTQNNKTALISNGARVPVQTVQRGVITTRFVSAALTLGVTPQITSDETIIMDINLDKSEPDFTRASGVGGNPIINTSAAITQVLVKNGGTAVIGGIFTLNEQLTGSGIPKLRKVPFLRRMFGSDRREYTNQELLIFVTPRIVKY